jgi:MFS family permease
VGCVFGTCIGTALKWFPDRRGLATGLIAMGYGLGAAASVIPLAGMIQSNGYRRAFLVFGLIQGQSLFSTGLFLLKPVVRTPGTTTGARAAQVDIGSHQNPAQRSLVDNLPGLSDDRLRRDGDDGATGPACSWRRACRASLRALRAKFVVAPMRRRLLAKYSLE